MRRACTRRSTPFFIRRKPWMPGTRPGMTLEQGTKLAHDFELVAGDRLVPVEDLHAVPVQHAVEAAHVVVDRLEILDPVRLAADVGMDRQRHDLGAVAAFGVEPVELIDRALEQIVALVVLHDHHRDVVQLDGVGQRDQRALGGLDHGRLVVIDPVADVFDAGLRQQFRRLQRLRQAGAEPADRPRAGEFLDHVHRAVDHRRLVFVLVDRQLVVGVAHELPAVLLGLLGDARIVLADAGVGGERRLDAEAGEQFVEPPGADPHAVFVPAPVRHVGQQHLPGRRRDHLARHRPRRCPTPRN